MSGSTTSATPTQLCKLATGTPLKAISERLGHSTIAITGDLYAHVIEELDTEAVRRLDEMLGS